MHELNSVAISCDAVPRQIIPSKKLAGSAVPKGCATESAVQFFYCIQSVPVLQPFDIFAAVTSQPLVASVRVL